MNSAGLCCVESVTTAVSLVHQILYAIIPEDKIVVDRKAVCEVVCTLYPFWLFLETPSDGALTDRLSRRLSQ